MNSWGIYKNSEKAFIFYQSIGLIPLGAKRRDWVLHHIDTTLKTRDYERYSQYNIYDVIPVPTNLHGGIHSKVSPRHFSHSEETRRKMSESHKGLRLSEETKLKLSKIHKNVVHTPEWNKKVSESKMGSSSPAKGKHWYTDGKEDIMEYDCPVGFRPGRCYFDSSRKRKTI